jgi:hypothetical protein
MQIVKDVKLQIVSKPPHVRRHDAAVLDGGLLENEGPVGMRLREDIPYGIGDFLPCGQLFELDIDALPQDGGAFDVTLQFCTEAAGDIPISPNTRTGEAQSCREAFAGDVDYYNLRGNRGAHAFSFER